MLIANNKKLFSDLKYNVRKCAGSSGRIVWSRSPAEIVGSNTTGSMDVCQLWVLCVVR